MFGHTFGGIIQIVQLLIGFCALVRVKINSDAAQPSKSKWYHIFFPRFSGGGPYYPYENQFATKTGGNAPSISKITWHTELSDFQLTPENPSGPQPNAQPNQNNRKQTKENLFEDLHLNGEKHALLESRFIN